MLLITIVRHEFKVYVCNWDDHLQFKVIFVQRTLRERNQGEGQCQAEHLLSYLEFIFRTVENRFLEVSGSMYL